MPSTYSTNLRLELIATGEKSGTWGDITNTNIGQLLEEAIGGYVTVTMTDAPYTLTTNSGAPDEARNACIRVTGTLSATRNVVCPNIEKIYVVWNNTTGGQSIVFKTASGTGVTIANGNKAIVFADGTNVVDVLNVLAVAQGGTGATTATTARTNLAAAGTGVSNTFTADQVISVNSSSSALRITQTGAGNALVVEDSTNPDATPFVIDASGSVGIGRSTAINGKLTVGNDRVAVPYNTVMSTYNGGVFENDIIAGFDGTSGFIGNFQNYRFDLYTNAVPRLTISAGGEVGIGTTSPVTKLHIVGSDSNANILAAGASKALRVTPTSTHVQLEGTDNTGLASYEPLVLGGSTLQFATGGSERMRIDASGNVGIGTTNPAVPLDVVSAGIRLNTSAQISTNSNSGVLVLWGGAAGDGANIELCGSTSADPNAAYFDASTHFFRNANATSERLRINSSGALGFGGANFGTSGQALISGGSAAIPSWGTLGVAGGGTGSATAAGARTNLGLGSIATQASSSVSITGGSISGITDLAIADGGTGASTAAAARTNLGLGTIATQESNAVAITGGSISGITDLAIADGGTGASDAAGARTNLGLGALATLNTVGASQINDNSVTGAKIALGSDAQGDIMYYNGTDWARLGAGAAGQLLKTNGASANPEWSSSIIQGTAVSSTSGSAIDFTNIPSWVKRITIMFSQVSTSGSAVIAIQLGDDGGIETTGYSGTSMAISSGGQSISSITSEIFLSSGADTSSVTRTGSIVLANLSGNLWIASGIISYPEISRQCIVSSGKSLSSTLTQIRISCLNTFDAGSINILYE